MSEKIEKQIIMTKKEEEIYSGVLSIYNRIDRFLDNITINAGRDDYSLTFRFDVRDYSYNENFDDIIKVIEDKGSKAYNTFFDNKKYHVTFNYGWEREIKKMYVEKIKIDWKRLYILIDLDYAND